MLLLKNSPRKSTERKAIPQQVVRSLSRRGRREDHGAERWSVNFPRCPLREVAVVLWMCAFYVLSLFALRAIAALPSCCLGAVGAAGARRNEPRIPDAARPEAFDPEWGGGGSAADSAGGGGGKVRGLGAFVRWRRRRRRKLADRNATEKVEAPPAGASRPRRPPPPEDGPPVSPRPRVAHLSLPPLKPSSGSAAVAAAWGSHSTGGESGAPPRSRFDMPERERPRTASERNRESRVHAPRRRSGDQIPLDERLRPVAGGASDSAEKCVAVSGWQTASFPTCNVVHEMGMTTYAVGESAGGSAEGKMRWIGSGGLRDVWKVAVAPADETFVLKTLRLRAGKRDFVPREFERSRKDAVAMERLSGSPYVVDIFGFCGMSALNEIAESSALSLSETDLLPKEVLKFALDAALGLAAAHGIDEAENGDIPPTMAHRDVAAKNFVVTGSSLKLNDFNFATFLKWDPTTKRRCGFKKSVISPYRSPEEISGQVQTEKVDMYALANVYYFLLTGNEPYSLQTNTAAEQRTVHDSIANGILPDLPDRLRDADADPSIAAVVAEMDKCYSFVPCERPSARETADRLQQVYVRLHSS